MRRKLIIAAALAASSAIAATLASAMNSPGDPSGSWAWNAGVPGRPVDARGIVAFTAKQSGLDARGLRELVTGRTGTGSLSVLAGKNAAGQVCLSFTRGGLFAYRFRCLTGEVERPLVYWVSTGGPSADSVDWASVAGVVRSDVSRVTLRFADGTARDLSLNAWRGFAHYAGSAAEIPEALLAYADGDRVAEIDLRYAAGR